MMQFQKAQRRKARLRLGLTGPSGSGKTAGALMIAKGIGGRIALIDTEHESASLYSEPVRLTGGAVFEPPEFDALNLSPPYAPERFIEAIQAAEAAEYDVLIIDGATPEWNGPGGCLELVDQIAAAKFKGNSWSAWNEITPRHRKFLDAILRSTMHIIVTVRSKTETAQTEENGRKRVVRLGMKAEQRDGLEYELTTVMDLIHDGHYATATKDRTGLFVGDPHPLSEATGSMLLDWLENGAEIGPTPEALAIKALDDCDTADAFTSTWNGNKESWRQVMGDVAYARVVAHMRSLAPKFAPPKSETPEPETKETVTKFQPRSKAETADSVIEEMRRSATVQALDDWTDSNIGRINALGNAGVDKVQTAYSVFRDELEAVAKPRDESLDQRAFHLETALKACETADELRATYDAGVTIRDALEKGAPERLDEVNSLYEGLFLTLDAKAA